MQQFHFHFGGSAASPIQFPVKTNRDRSDSKSRSRKRKSIKDHKRSRSKTPCRKTSKTYAIQDAKDVKRTKQKKAVLKIKSPKTKSEKKGRKRSQSSSSNKSSRSPASSSSEEFVPAASARTPNVQTGWQTPTSQPNPYMSFAPMTGAPPNQFIGPQSAFRTPQQQIRPSTKPDDTPQAPISTATTPAVTQHNTTTQPLQPQPQQEQQEQSTTTQQQLQVPPIQPTNPQPGPIPQPAQPGPVPKPGPPPPYPPPAATLQPPPPPKTIGIPLPQYQPRIRFDPYSQIHTSVKAAPPLPPEVAHRLAPGKWGDPQQILQSLGTTVAHMESKLPAPGANPTETNPSKTSQQASTEKQQTDKQNTPQDSQANTATSPLTNTPPQTNTPTPAATPAVTLVPAQASTSPQPPAPRNTPALEILKTKLQKSTPSNTSQASTSVANTQRPIPTTNPTIQLLPRRDTSNIRLVPNSDYLSKQQTSASQTSASPQETPQTEPQTHITTAPSTSSTLHTVLPTTNTTSTTAATQMFTALQQKATQHTQQPDMIEMQTVGPAVQAWQMVEQVPTNDQDKEEYERNRFEFKSWKGTIKYPAPPTQLWQSTQTDLTELYRTNSVPAIPEFEHRYLAALFAAIGPVSEQIEKIRFFASDQEAIWLLMLKRPNPPTLATVWNFSYQFYHGTETGSLWSILRERMIRPSLADDGSVGFYCRASNDLGDWATINCIRKVMSSGKWSTPAIIGGIAETTSQHHTMSSGDGSQAQAACRVKGLVHMKRDKKWLVRSDLAQVTCIALPVIRESALADIDARNSRITQQSITGR